MSDSPADPLTPASTPPAEDRLESWKDIATYLDKDVRTVQRWEKDAGLPVCRPSQGKVTNLEGLADRLASFPPVTAEQLKSVNAAIQRVTSLKLRVSPDDSSVLKK